MQRLHNTAMRRFNSRHRNGAGFSVIATRQSRSRSARENFTATSPGYPNGQQALYSYSEDNTQDRRMSQIKHLTPTSTLLDEFDYTYDGPLGRIATWNQQQPSASVGSMATNDYALRYDAIGQLRQAVLNGDSTNPGSGVWSYDPAGSRIGVQSGSGTLSTAVPTSTNSLFSLSGGGSVFVAGTLSKWANLTVNSQPASLNAANNSFQAFVPLPTGVQTISISATDVDGNTATNAYHLTVSAGAGESFAYDANGNTTTLTPTTTGATPETFEWDAVDRVTAINIGAHRTQFAYDGNGARVRITEMDSGSVTTDRLYVANEERDAVGGQVLRTFYGRGEQRLAENATANFFYSTDYLGSTKVLSDSTGAVRASYNYDPWGAPIKLQGNLDTEVRFTGYWYDSATLLELSLPRLYSSFNGRFISRDPIAERGGNNLYEYVGSNPITLTDRYGLDPAYAPDIGISDNTTPVTGTFVFVGGKGGGPGPLTSEGLFIGGITPNNRLYGGPLGATGKEWNVCFGPARFDIGTLTGFEQTNLGTNGIGLFDLDLGCFGVGAYWSSGSYGLYGYGNYGNVFGGAGVEFPK
jgi:RHS repeat-associated protein